MLIASDATVKTISGQRLGGLVGLLALVAACGGGSGDGGDGPAATPVPSSTPPSPSPNGSSHTTAFPAPAPSPYPACTPSSTDPCALLDVTTETDGAMSPYLSSGVFVDDTSVYWGTKGMAVTVVHSVPKSGAQLGVDASIAVATVDYSASFVVGATSLLWTDHGSLESAPKTGAGSPTVLASDKSIGALAVDATDVYFAGSTAVSRVPLGGGPVTPLTTLATGVYCSSLVLSDADVYCRTPDDVLRFPKSGGPATSVLQAKGYYLALLDSKMYADNRVAGAEVVTLPLAGGAPMIVPVGTSDFDNLHAFGGALYFLSSQGGGVHRAPLDGSPPTSVPVTGGFFGNDLAVDASGVYWVDRRWTCLLESFTPSTGRSDPGSSRCLKGLGELRVVRMPLVF